VRGLLVDFGGVLTSNVFASFRDFCVAEGLNPDAVRRLFREDPRALALVRGLETGALGEDQFGERFGELLELDDRVGLVERMFGGLRPDEEMLGALRRARAAGIRTGLVSNSMGAGRYDRASFPELFDGVVISGDEGMHKPEPEIYELGCERVGPRAGRVRVRGRPPRELRGRGGRRHDRRAAQGRSADAAAAGGATRSRAALARRPAAPGG
jgi:putative hydrolase of the HAD superfamily